MKCRNEAAPAKQITAKDFVELPIGDLLTLGYRA
jgi:hypothetical protein